MKIDVQELKEKRGTISIEDTKPYFVNSLRRTMISDLPKLAIEDVIIYDNTSALFDEIIAHRLGLLPIPTDLSLLTYKDKCKCEGKGCPSCTVRYTISKEGEGMIYSGDLQPQEKSWKIKEDKIPIVELFEDQRLILEVEAVLGKGRNHAKWQPVISPGYRFKADITYDEKHKSDVEEFIEKLPKGIAELKKGKIEILDIKKIPIFESYMDKYEIDFINIYRDPTKIIFSYETDGALSAKDALVNTCKILQEKYSTFAKELAKIK